MDKVTVEMLDGLYVLSLVNGDIKDNTQWAHNVRDMIAGRRCGYCSNRVYIISLNGTLALCHINSQGYLHMVVNGMRMRLNKSGELINDGKMFKWEIDNVMEQAREDNSFLKSRGCFN